MNRLEHVRALLACLRGEVPGQADWLAIISLANRALCTPAITTSLQEAGEYGALPADVQTFLEEVWARNSERNRRLLIQLDEAASLLNSAGVQPVLLKGTAWLARAPADSRGARMLGDLDLMVPPAQFDAAIDRLARVGYRLGEAVISPEVPALLWRPEDAATIDLHSDYGSSTTLLYRFEDLARDASRFELPTGSVLIPSDVALVAILLIHDQLKGRDYLRGRIDLRHLLDIQLLAQRFGGSEWRALDRLFAKGYARKAARTQLLTARELLGVDVPDEIARGFWPRLQYRRRLIQLWRPATTLPFTILSLLDPSYLRARRASRSKGGLSTTQEQPKGWLPRRTSLARLLIRREMGKIDTVAAMRYARRSKPT